MSVSHEDRDGILELLAMYNAYADASRWSEWATLFEPDGQRLAGSGDLVTKADFDQWAAEKTANPNPLGRHWLGNILIERLPGDGDRAVVNADIMLIRPAEPGRPGEIVFMSKVEDIVRKIDGRWRFERRTMRPSDTIIDSR